MLIIVTGSGNILLINANTGRKLAQTSVQILPTEIVVSQNGQYVAVSGTTVNDTST